MPALIQHFNLPETVTVNDNAHSGTGPSCLLAYTPAWQDFDSGNIEPGSWSFDITISANTTSGYSSYGWSSGELAIIDAYTGGTLERVAYWNPSGEIYDDGGTLQGTGTATIAIVRCNVCPYFVRMRWLRQCGDFDIVTMQVDGTRTAGCV